MKTKLLLPHWFRFVGLVLLIPGLIMGYLYLYHSNWAIEGFGLKLREKGNFTAPAFENFTNELSLLLVIVGLIGIAFAKLKKEDELTAAIRLNALYWSIIMYYLLYVVIVLISVGVNYINPDLWENINFDFPTYNLFTPLIFFICKFYYTLYKSKNQYILKHLKFLPHMPYYYLGKWCSMIAVLAYGIGVVSWSLSGEHFVWLNLFTLTALLLWSYSKQKHEDEYVNQLRLHAMQLAIYMNYGMLIIANLFLFSLSFLLAEYLFLISIPLFYLVIFHYRQYRSNHGLNKAVSTFGIL